MRWLLMLYCLVIAVACNKEDRYSRKVVGSWVPYYLSGRWGKKAVWRYHRNTYVFTRGGRYYFLGDACGGDILEWGRYEIRHDTLYFYYEGHDSTKMTYAGSYYYRWLIDGFSWSPRRGRIMRVYRSRKTLRRLEECPLGLKANY